MSSDNAEGGYRDAQTRGFLDKLEMTIYITCHVERSVAESKHPLCKAGNLYKGDSSTALRMTRKDLGIPRQARNDNGYKDARAEALIARTRQTSANKQRSDGGVRYELGQGGRPWTGA